MTAGWHANPEHSLASPLVFKILDPRAEQIVERNHAHKPAFHLGIENWKSGETRLRHSPHDNSKRFIGKCHQRLRRCDVRNS